MHLPCLNRGPKKRHTREWGNVRGLWRLLEGLVVAKAQSGFPEAQNTLSTGRIALLLLPPYTPSSLPRAGWRLPEQRRSNSAIGLVPTYLFWASRASFFAFATSKKPSSSLLQPPSRTHIFHPHFFFFLFSFIFFFGGFLQTPCMRRDLSFIFNLRTKAKVMRHACFEPPLKSPNQSRTSDLRLLLESPVNPSRYRHTPPSSV